MTDLRKAAENALEALKNNRRNHYYCEDTWYSCPKHEDGCANESAGNDCDCGADETNQIIDFAIASLRQALAQSEQKPVAQIRVKNGYWIDTPRSKKVKSLPDGLHDLYTAPIRQEWQELYKDEIKEILNDGEEWSSLEFAQAVSDLLREKNA
jgi:hypothetical protein